MKESNKDNEAAIDINKNNTDYSEYIDIIKNLSIEEPDLYNLEAIKNDTEYNKLIKASRKINLNNFEQISKIMERTDKLKEKHRKSSFISGKNHRNIDTIAYEIIEDWNDNISDKAKPYLNAMTRLTCIDDMYGNDSAESIIRYFLANSQDYQSEKAKKIKKELKNIINNYEKEKSK